MLGIWFLGGERNQQRNPGNEGQISCLPIECGKKSPGSSLRDNI